MMAMSTHSVAEAKNQLSRLIERALEGESVIITRHGHPVVEIKPLKSPVRHTAKEALAWLEGKRVKLRGEAIDPVELVSRIRDADWR
jgi:prevent-host-death family protein